MQFNHWPCLLTVAISLSLSFQAPDLLAVADPADPLDGGGVSILPDFDGGAPVSTLKLSGDGTALLVTTSQDFQFGNIIFTSPIALRYDLDGGFTSLQENAFDQSSALNISSDGKVIVGN